MPAGRTPLFAISSSLVGVFLLMWACGGSPFSSTPDGSAGAGGAALGGKGGSGSSQESPVGGDTLSGGAGGANSSAGSAGVAGSRSDSDGGEPNAAGVGAGGEPNATCPSAVSTGYEVGFFPELQTTSSQEIHPFFELSTSTASVSLARLSIRYYFSKEADAVETGSCYWVTGDHCANVHLSWHDVAVPTPSADRFLEVRFDGEQSKLTSLESVEVRVGFFAAQKVMLQSNDYSFDTSALKPTASKEFPYKPWPKVTLYLDDQLVWGTEPCPQRPSEPSTAR